MKMIVPPSLGGARTSARAELLQSSLSNELRREVEVIAATSYSELRDAVMGPTVDLAWTPAAVLAEVNEVRDVLRAVRGGHARYHSALIAREGSGVSLSSLNGKRAAWVDPLSVGGHLLAVSWLRGQGLDANLTFASQEFLGSHRAVVDAVLDGKADLTAVSTPTSIEAEVRQSLAFYAGSASEKLAIVGVTGSAPTDALVITNRLSVAEAERVAQCLLPRVGRARTPSFLLTAMEAERLERSDLTDYRALKSLLWRKSEHPSRRGSTGRPPS